VLSTPKIDTVTPEGVSDGGVTLESVIGFVLGVPPEILDTLMIVVLVVVFIVMDFG